MAKKSDKSGKKLANKGLFKPGDDPRRNLEGRPKGALGFATKWKIFLNKIAENEGRTADEIEADLLEVALEKAKKGDSRFWENIFDRVYGKPVQAFEVEGQIKTDEQRVPTEAELKATRAYEEALIKELKGDKGKSKKE